jgi:signal transduction histidine kinase
MILRLGQTMDDILEMTKFSERKVVLKRKRLDFNWMFRYVMFKAMPFIEKRGLNISWETEPALFGVGDRGKLELAFYNVIENAVKFTPDGGWITIEIERVPGGISVCIRDTGIGIPENEIERIFDMFYTSADTSRHSSGSYEFSARGTGLGLTITKSYIEAHGGTITAFSEGPGKGTTVTIVLPDSSEEDAEGLVGGD